MVCMINLDPTENDSMFGHLFETEIQDQESSKSTLSGQDDSVSESPWKPEGKRSSAELVREDDWYLLPQSSFLN